MNSTEAAADYLLADILAGHFPPGSQLPTVKELCDLYDRSGPTMNRAVGLLRDRGYVRSQHGVGSWVVDRLPDRGPEQALDRLLDLVEQLKTVVSGLDRIARELSSARPRARASLLDGH